MSIEKCPVCGNLVFTNDSRAKSDAFEALADIRGWACETLDASAAGKLCGMLSEVSRHANGLEAENAKLKNLVCNLYDDLAYASEPPDWIDEYKLDMRELGIEVG